MNYENKSSVQDFADTIRDNPKAIIAWARREIREYEKLIKILERPEMTYTGKKKKEFRKWVGK
jgi:hypothetical protein